MVSAITAHSTWYCPKICNSGLVKPVWKPKATGYCVCICHASEDGVIEHFDGDMMTHITWTDEAKARMLENESL